MNLENAVAIHPKDQIMIRVRRILASAPHEIDKDKPRLISWLLEHLKT